MSSESLVNEDRLDLRLEYGSVCGNPGHPTYKAYFVWDRSWPGLGTDCSSMSSESLVNEDRLDLELCMAGI